MVGIVVKSPRPEGMPLHPLGTEICDPTEVGLRIWKEILKNPQRRLHKRSDEQDCEKNEPFPRPRNDKNEQAMKNPSRKNEAQNRALQPQVGLACQRNYNPCRKRRSEGNTGPSRHERFAPLQLPSTSECGQTKNGIGRQRQKWIRSPAHKILGNEKRKAT